MSIKFLVLGGGGILGFGGRGGGGADFIFMGARIFLKICVNTLRLLCDTLRRPEKVCWAII